MPSTNSRLAGAFASLQKAKAGATGKREYVLLNGKEVEGLVSEITANDEFISGGTAQAGGFMVQVAQSAVAESPVKGDDIECRGQELKVLSANDVNGVTWDITAGDLLAT
jgi:hypothetical protein